MPHPTTKTAAGRGAASPLSAPAERPTAFATSAATSATRETTSGCARPGSASWCSARSSASLSAIARRTPGAPSASSARPCGDTRSVGGTASSETRGGGMPTRGAPRRRRARPARRRVWRRERPRTRAARTLKTFGAGPSLGLVRADRAQNRSSEERNARRSQRARHVCPDDVAVASRDHATSRSHVCSSSRVRAGRRARRSTSPSRASAPPPDRPPAHLLAAPSRGARSRRPLARVRASPRATRWAPTRAAAAVTPPPSRIASRGTSACWSARPRRTASAPAWR